MGVLAPCVMFCPGMAGAPDNGDDDEPDDFDTVMSVPGMLNFDDLPTAGAPAPTAPVAPAAPAAAAPTRPTPMPQVQARPTPISLGPVPGSRAATPRTTPSVSIPVAPAPAPTAAPRMSARRPAVTTDDVEPAPRRLKKTLLPDDLVPQFRSELTLTRTLSGSYEVTNPDSGQTFALNEFEVSLARMLNGRRQVSEILEAGNRLEIPITIESLQKFIQQLEECGFLGSSDGPAADGKTWPARGQWDTAVRSFFQSGVRLLRMGKHAEAATCFEAMLEEDPNNLEARELLAVARQHASVALSPASAMVALPMVSPSAGHHMAGQSMPMGIQPMGAQPMAISAGGDIRRYLRPILIGAAALVVVAIGGYLLSRGKGNATTEPEPTAKPVVVITPDPVKPDPVKPDPVKPDPVKPDPEKPDPTKPDPTKADPTKVDPTKVDPTKADPTKPDPTKPDPTKPDPTKPDPKPALAAVQVEAPAGGDVTAYLRGPRMVRKGERLFEITRVVGDPAKIKTATAKLADLENLAKSDHATYDAFVADARKELANVRKVSSTTVTAPRAGKAEPKVKSNATVRAGQVLAVIAATE